MGIVCGVLRGHMSLNFTRLGYLSPTNQMSVSRFHFTTLALSKIKLYADCIQFFSSPDLAMSCDIRQVNLHLEVIY